MTAMDLSLAPPGVAVFLCGTKVLASNNTTAMASTTMIQRSSLLPVSTVMDSSGLISLSRAMPCGVHSKNHENSIANGNPTMAATTIQRTTQFGISKNGKTWVAICTSSHALAA